MKISPIWKLTIDKSGQVGGLAAFHQNQKYMHSSSSWPVGGATKQYKTYLKKYTIKGRLGLFF